MYLYSFGGPCYSALILYFILWIFEMVNGLLSSFFHLTMRKYIGNVSICNIHNYRSIKELCLIRPKTEFSINYRCQCNKIRQYMYLTTMSVYFHSITVISLLILSNIEQYKTTLPLGFHNTLNISINTKHLNIIKDTPRTLCSF